MLRELQREVRRERQPMRPAVSSPWLPKSVVALRHYDLDDVPARPRRRRHRRPRRAAARDGVRHRLGPHAAGRHLLRRRDRVHHLGRSADRACRSADRPAPSSSWSPASSPSYGVSGLFMCTMMAGVILVMLGLTRSGSAVRFIPRPVVVGFTNGIAVLIASTQIRDFLGLQMHENRAASSSIASRAHWRAICDTFSRRRPPWRSARWSWCSPRIASSRSCPGHDRRPRRRDARGLARRSCRSTPWRRGSAACRQDCRRFRFRRSTRR